MIPERSVIEQAYAFFHQKLKVYEHSTSEKEMDHIEDVIASYVDGMSPSLYEALAEGKASFLHEHGYFREELSEAVRKMESWLEQGDETPDKDNRYVVGLGEILWDKLSKYGKPVRRGRKLGGAPANFAYHVSQFGHNGLVVSAIGYDREGNDIVTELAKHNLCCHLERVPYPTGTVDADITDPNSPVYTIRTYVAWNHIAVTDDIRRIASGTKAVCFGTLAQWGRESRNTIRVFLDHCPEDCLKICDINLRQRFFTKATIKESLHRADILKLNERELSMITGLLGYKMAGEETLCRRLMGLYDLKMIILTKGIDGSWILYKDGKSFQGTPKVKVKSAVGAGDSFTGAFVGCLLNGDSIKEAHRKAVRVSAYVCTKEGAMPEIPASLVE